MDTAVRIQRIIGDALAIEAPAITTDVLEAGILDSLALITVLFEIEQEFAIAIPLQGLDIESLRTVERMAALVEELGGG
jgi:acyl carrier protein